MLICESCNHGTPSGAPGCQWCGAPAHIMHESTAVSMVDTECYIDYWLCAFSTGETFQLFAGHPLDIAGLRQALSRYTIVTFNGVNYDLPIIALALAGATNETLRHASDLLIQHGWKWWNVLKHFNVQRPEWIDHIDMFDVAPGQGSLKSYGARMHTKRLQDLPIEPGASINWAQRALLREYCRNDLQVTRELFDTFQTQLELRRQMSAEYGVDVRSKSDAQIAETVMKQILPYKPDVPTIPPGTTFYYRPPAWMTFQTLNLLELLARSPFTVTDSGSVAMTQELEKTVVRIGSTQYHMGIGGLHSMESSIVHRSDDEFILTDHDVASYYPSLILCTQIYPQQIGEAFQEIYRGWYYRRLAAKRAGDKKNANSLKTLLNGTFGKLGSPYSIFYAPSELIQVTVTGQLALLMLIEMLELSGIQVVSANTDGIVVKCRRSSEWLRDSIIKWWEETTGFETERSDYVGLFSRDVNNYVALYADGKAKLKGAYAPPEPGASGWPNPTGQVCVQAVVAYLRDGVPLEQTIRECTDIRQFIYVRSVKGGGVHCPHKVLPTKTTKKEMAKYADYAAAVAESRTGTQYLGKVVRWYYGRGSTATIRYNGSLNLVPRTEGCVPCMTLPESLPTDIDYDWYIAEARGLLVDVGVNL